MADDKRKKRGRSKILRSCFRPLAADEGPSSSEKTDGRDTKNGRLGKPVLIAVSGRKGNGFIEDVHLVNGGDCYAKRRSPRRRFSRIIKAVLFDSVMAKKIRRSSSKSSIASDTTVSSSSSEKICKSSTDANACSKEYKDMEDSCSRPSDLLSSSSRTTSSSSSSSSSVNSDSRWSSDQKTSSRIDSVDPKPLVSLNSSIQKNLSSANTSSRSCLDQKVSSRTDSHSLHLRRQDSSISLPLARPKPLNSFSKSSSYQKGLSRLDSRNSVSSNSPSLTKSNPDKMKSGSNNWNLRWCLFILLSLAVLVIWGRIFSILCTSIWFYLAPCRSIKHVNSVANSADFLDIDSVQYKKRVIMAGLLERTRNPLR